LLTDICIIMILKTGALFNIIIATTTTLNCIELHGEGGKEGRKQRDEKGSTRIVPTKGVVYTLIPLLYYNIYHFTTIIYIMLLAAAAAAATYMYGKQCEWRMRDSMKERVSESDC